MKITVDGTRYDLSTMIALGCSTRENHGVSVTEVFFGPRSHRLIEEYYSIWESGRNDGTVTGTYYTVYDPADYGWVAAMTWALEHSDGAHDNALRAALDKHAPALTD